MYRIALLFLATFAATAVAQQLSPVPSPLPLLPRCKYQIRIT